MLARFSSTPVVADFKEGDTLDKISIVFQGNAEKGYVVADLKKETVDSVDTALLNAKKIIYNKNGTYSKVITDEIAKLNGADTEVPVPPLPLVPQKTIENLLTEIETAVTSVPVDTSKILDKAEAIKTEADKIPDKAEAIKNAADAITLAAKEIKEEDDKGEAKTEDEAAIAKRTELDTNIKAAIANIRALIAPTESSGGYISARSAVPKRITRMRKTRRANKTSGTRRRRRLHI